jgi:hypothetical protein
MDPGRTPACFLVHIPLPTSRRPAHTPALCPLWKTRSSMLHATETGAASCTMEPLTWSTWAANCRMQPHLMDSLVSSCISAADPPVALSKAASCTFPQKTYCHRTSNKASALIPRLAERPLLVHYVHYVTCLFQQGVI